MDLDRDRALGAIALALLFGACWRPARGAPDTPPAGAQRRASPSNLAPPDAGPPLAPEALRPPPTQEPEDKERDRALHDLSSEHYFTFRPAMVWLVEHPARARPPLVEWVASVPRERLDLGACRAMKVLGRIGDPADVPLLARRLNEAHWTMAGDAAYGLALHRDPSARAALVEAMDSPITELARVAIGALGERREEATRPLLEGRLAAAEKELRYATVHALIDLGAGGSREALRRRLAVETDREVRFLIRKALRKPPRR